jgi:hypothetical protein
MRPRAKLSGNDQAINQLRYTPEVFTGNGEGKGPISGATEVNGYLLISEKSIHLALNLRAVRVCDIW